MSPLLVKCLEIEPRALVLLVLRTVLDKCFRLDYSTATPAWAGASIEDM